MKEIEITKAIISKYMETLLDNLVADVAIVGSGPAGLVAAYYLSKSGVKTVVFEKKLSIGGGIWGGAAGYNVIAIEDTEIVTELGIETEKREGLYVADSIEFAAAAGYKARKAGARIFNLIEVEDVILKRDRVEGLVLNNAAIRILELPVDPFCVRCKCVVDATGHEARIVDVLRKKVEGFSPSELREGPMDVERAEEEVVERTGEVYPGLYVAGMAVCATYHLPRMGPIFGGMIRSGKKVAEMISEVLASSPPST